MKYTVEVTSKVTLEIEADSAEEATEIAGATAWEHDADSIDIVVVKRPVIRCNNCEKIFYSEQELALFVEIRNGADDFRVVKDSTDLELPEPGRYERFAGCPVCMTDAYLMEVDE